jgi:hypothetical protein
MPTMPKLVVLKLVGSAQWEDEIKRKFFHDLFICTMPRLNSSADFRDEVVKRRDLQIVRAFFGNRFYRLYLGIQVFPQTPNFQPDQ